MKNPKSKKKDKEREGEEPTQTRFTSGCNNRNQTSEESRQPNKQHHFTLI
jgi:hypothetical protein